MAKCLVSFSCDINKALQALEKSNKQAEKALVKTAAHAGAIVRKNMQTVLGVQRQLHELPNGRFKWDNPSKAGEPSRRRTGKLQRSIRFEAQGKSAKLYSEYQGANKRQNNNFLARIMETGTYKMAPRPFVKRSVDKSLSRIGLILASQINTDLSQ